MRDARLPRPEIKRQPLHTGENTAQMICAATSGEREFFERGRLAQTGKEACLGFVHPLACKTFCPCHRSFLGDVCLGRKDFAHKEFRKASAVEHLPSLLAHVRCHKSTRPAAVFLGQATLMRGK